MTLPPEGCVSVRLEIQPLSRYSATHFRFIFWNPFLGRLWQTETLIDWDSLALLKADALAALWRQTFVGAFTAYASTLADEEPP